MASYLKDKNLYNIYDFRNYYLMAIDNFNKNYYIESDFPKT